MGGLRTRRPDTPGAGWRGYAVAVALTALAFSVRLALDPILGGVQPFAFFYLSVAFAAWWGGMGPAAFAAIAGSALGTLAFLDVPRGLEARSVAATFVYASICVCIVGLVAHARQSEARLAASEQHLRRVLDNLFAFVGVMTPDGTLVEINRAPLEAGGIGPADALGRKLWDVRWWSHSTELQAKLRDAIDRARAGEVVRFDAQVRMAGDSRMWIDFQIAPLRDDEGRVTHLVPSAMDLTERKRAEAAAAESERGFQEAFEHAPVGMVLADLDGRLLHVNRAYCEMLGYSAEELLREHVAFTRLTHPDDVEANLVAWRKLVAGEVQVYFVEKRYLRKDGREVWVRASASLRRDAEGRPFQVVGIVEDVDERRRAEASLAQATTLLSAISDNTGDAIFAKDREGRLTFANPATLALVGKPLAEVLGRTDAEILGDPEAARAVMDNDRRVMETGRAADLEELVPLPDGTRRIWFSRKVPYRDATGEVVGLLGVSRDVTESRDAQESLRRSEARHRDLARVVEAERAKLRAVIDNLPVGVAIGDDHGVILSLNKVGLALHGFADEDEMPRTLADYARDFELRTLDGRLLPLEAWPGSRARHGDYVRDFEAILHDRRRGISRVVAYSVVPVGPDEGGARVLVYVMQDLTEQTRAEEALRESEERFRAVADNIPVLAWMVDATGRMLWFNRRWVDYTGMTLEDMRRGDWGSVHAPEHAAPVAEGWVRALETGEPWEDTFPLRGRDGGLRWFLSRAFPIRDASGAIERWFGTNTDITDQKRIEAALRESEEHLRELLQREAEHAAHLERTVAERTVELTDTIHELEAFSYSLSHDMRAPLRAMKGFSQILEAEHGAHLGPDGRLYLGKIARAAGRLDQLIQDVLTYSRIVGEKVDLQPIDVEKLAHQLVDENPALQPPRAEVAIASPLHPVLGHEAYLMQILSNLVYNAVKFVSDGQEPRVRIWTEADDGAVRLYVQDNGIGIAPEAQERIFGMFQRLHGDRAYEGTGIGLTIVRKAVERMGGCVGVSSEPGCGSTFWVQLRGP